MEFVVVPAAHIVGPTSSESDPTARSADCAQCRLTSLFLASHAGSHTLISKLFCPAGFWRGPGTHLMSRRRWVVGGGGGGGGRGKGRGGRRVVGGGEGGHHE